MENETQNSAPGLLGIEKPDYSKVEVGKWKPQEGFAQYTLSDERVEIRKGKDPKTGVEMVYKVLCLVIKPAYEGKVRTLEMSVKDNPKPRTNYGKWVTFVKNVYAGAIPKGTVFGIYAKPMESNPDAMLLDFTKTEQQQATGASAPQGSQ